MFPLLGPPERSTPMSGNSFARSRKSPGPDQVHEWSTVPMSWNAEYVTPKSRERENAMNPVVLLTLPDPSGQLIVLAPFSHTTYTSPLGPQKGREACLDAVGVVVASRMICGLHVAPW